MELDFRTEYYRGLNNKIGLKGNPVTNPPQEIIEQGNKAIIRYFENLEKNAKKGLEPVEIRELKIIVLGEGESGKTTLIKRLIGQPVNENEKQTQGIKQVNWTIENSKGNIKANIWDFGGQEIQHSTHQFFLTEECIYILVLDNRRDEQPEYWLQHILSLGKNSPILIVTNKVDKPEHAADRFNQDFLKSKYPDIQDFFKVSALCGNNFENFKEKLIEIACNINFPKFGPDWVEVKEYIEAEIVLGKNYLTYKQLHDYSRNLIDEKDEDIILIYLKKIGRVSFNEKNFITRNFYILNPEWLIYAFYKIILSGKTITQNGEIHLNDFDEILKIKDDDSTFQLTKKYEYDREHHGYLLEMMKEYHLCYSSDNQKIIIPSAFQESHQIDFEKNQQSLSFYFQYLDFLPPSIISQFIARMFQYRHKNAYWRSGIELLDSSTNTKVLVQVDKEQKRIYISANGEQRRIFFLIIRNTFKEIHKNFPEMRVEERIPLISSQPDQSVDYETLINHELDRKYEYYHGKTRERYRVSDLLASIEYPNITHQELINRGFTMNITNNNNPHFEQKVEQKNENHNINTVNLKVDVTKHKEFNQIKELLLDLEEYNIKNEDWKNALIKCLDEMNRLEVAEDKAQQKTSKSILDRGFKKLKDVKDVVTIGLLPVDITTKLPKLLELWNSFSQNF